LRRIHEERRRYRGEKIGGENMTNEKAIEILKAYNEEEGKS
jgi:hypothetical protein